MRSRVPGPVELSCLLYRRLLQVYPSAFHLAFGEEMAQEFRECCADAYRRYGPTGLIDVWSRALIDLTERALRHHGLLDQPEAPRLPARVGGRWLGGVVYRCSFCSEEINPTWRRCRYCGGRIFPFALRVDTRPSVSSVPKRPPGYVAAQLLSDPDRVYEWSYGAPSPRD